jgi:hypothetical protein
MGAGMIGHKLTGQLAKGGALHSRPIEKLPLADAVAAHPPPGIAAAVEVVARFIVRRDHPHSSRERTRQPIQ